MEGGTFSAALNGEEIIHWHMPTQTKLFQSHIVCITELIGATGMVAAKAHQCNLSSACIKSYQTFPQS